MEAGQLQGAVDLPGGHDGAYAPPAGEQALVHEALQCLACRGSGDLEPARHALRSAVTELQFHDMATQLIWHTTQVLQGCAFRLAFETMGLEEGEVPSEPAQSMMPERPNPVTQSEMDAGSVDLF